MIGKGPCQKQEAEARGPVSHADRSRITLCFSLLSLPLSWQ